jgi:hypothetical protein
MSARTLANRTGLLVLLREIRYTLSQVTAEPLATPHVGPFQQLRDEWKTVLLEEVDILEALSAAQAAVDKADDGLDDFAGRTWRAVEDFTGGNPKHPLQVHLFKGKPLGKFRRPNLGGQLEAMRDWTSPLSNSGAPALVALAADLPALIVAADKAVDLQKAAAQKNREFRDVGARKQLVDKVNARRKETYGALAKLPFEHPSLAADFADRFFRVEPAVDDEEETIEDVKAAVVDLEAELSQRKAQLATMEAEAAAAAKADAEKKVKELALEELEAQQAELAKKAAELKAQLGKK